MNLDDLSYSGVVKMLQHDENLGADLLNEIAKEQELVDSEIEKIEKELSRAKSRKNRLLLGVENTMKHLKKEYPLAVQRQSYIVVVTEGKISIERNVL